MALNRERRLLEISWQNTHKTTLNIYRKTQQIQKERLFIEKPNRQQIQKERLKPNKFKKERERPCNYRRLDRCLSIDVDKRYLRHLNLRLQRDLCPACLRWTVLIESNFLATLSAGLTFLETLNYVVGGTVNRDFKIRRRADTTRTSWPQRIGGSAAASCQPRSN